MTSILEKPNGLNIFFFNIFNIIIIIIIIYYLFNFKITIMTIISIFVIKYIKKFINYLKFKIIIKINIIYVNTILPTFRILI